MYFLANDTAQRVFQWLALPLYMGAQRFIHQRLVVTTPFDTVLKPLNNVRIKANGNAFLSCLTTAPRLPALKS